MEKQVQDLKKIIESSISDAHQKGVDTTQAVKDRLWALKQMVDSFLVPIKPSLWPAFHVPSVPSFMGTTTSGCSSLLTQPIINDLDYFPEQSKQYSDEEKILRCKLASVYRLVDLQGWTYGIYNHITVRVSNDYEHFLINPFGLQYNEITASSLLKVDIEGNVIDSGTTNFTFNKAGYVLHSAIHAARPDLKAVIHIHHPACVAVSSFKQGLLLTSQESAIVGPVSYHDYRGMLIDLQEREDIAKNLGPVNRVMILRNHGVVVGGRTLEEAFAMLVNVVYACESQIRMSAMNIDQIIQMPKSALDQVQAIIQAECKDAGSDAVLQGGDKSNIATVSQSIKIFDLEFEARMRMLDYWGLKTGYPYKVPPMKIKPKQVVEVGGEESFHNQLIGLFRKLLTHQE